MRRLRAESPVFTGTISHSKRQIAPTAILTRNQGSYVVSVRAPLANRNGADELCLKFETGGGRAAAAGINVLPLDQVENFVDAFNAQFAG